MNLRDTLQQKDKQFQFFEGKGLKQSSFFSPQGEECDQDMDYACPLVEVIYCISTKGNSSYANVENSRESSKNCE